MDKDTFVTRIKKVNEEINRKEVQYDSNIIKEGVNDYIVIQHQKHPDLPRGFMNMIIANEELCELGKEIDKWLRQKPDYYNLLQELADIQIGIYILYRIF